LEDPVTVLLADDDHDYRESLRQLLELDDYVVEEAASVEEAWDKLETTTLDLALVDLRFSDHMNDRDFSGLKVAKSAAERGVPCIIVTAFPSVEAARLALRSRGADPLAVDLVPKKDGPQAILDAIAVILTRTRAQQGEASGSIEVNLELGLATLRGQPLTLSRQQYSLLAFLYARNGAVCSSEELIKAVYDEDVPIGQGNTDRRLERLIARLREKIECDPHAPRHLLRVHGRGYRLDY